MPDSARETRSRRGVRLSGVVQGVGFRPTVYRVARALALGGLVRNDAEGVWIEVEGPGDPVRRFVEELRRALPPLARIDRLEVSELAPRGDSAFVIEGSTGPDTGRAIVPPDVATCEACLREMTDPADRRYRYPFINCTDCGPRYTIVRDLPYDRSRTTMTVFPLCEACRAEYEDPSTRRFHAEPVACSVCGPRLAFRSGETPGLEGEGALAAAAAALTAGRIVAVKGIGGYHLAVDATQDAAVQRLRARKGRPHKPLALMVRTLDEARALVQLDATAEGALTSPARPIVLAPAVRAGTRVAPGVAPGLDELGVMLAYAPLHHLLLSAGPPILVMTSGNRSEEPIAREDDAARERLAGIADAFLSHDRGIHTRADDSVVRIVAGRPQPVRRSRGHVAQAIALPVSAPALLAVGPQLKNTICVVRGDEAFLSPHVGDLDGMETHAFFEEVVEKMSRLLGVTPDVVAHDLHPDYASTRWALRSGLTRIPVQHHHAHVVSCLVDAGGHPGRTIGVAFDGTGCGPAGDLWGGEFLLFDLRDFVRVGHLRPLAASRR